MVSQKTLIGCMIILIWMKFRSLAEIEGTYGDQIAPRKITQRRVYWGRSDSCGPSSSKACREKARRDRLNDKFMELGSILEPGRPPKTDKAAILIDAVRMTEKNELRDEKQRLKAEKDKLEQQLKTMNTQPGYLPAQLLSQLLRSSNSSSRRQIVPSWDIQELPCGSSCLQLQSIRRRITCSAHQWLNCICP
ncbi:Transcription factor ILR3 [Bienertia sinuspersici]